MSTKAVLRVIAYLRVSGASQLDGDGFPRQLDACTKFCLGNELELVTAIEERAISGSADSADRPGFMKVLDYAQQNGIEAIVVERLDRLARDLMVQELLLKEIRDAGLKLYAADQGALVDLASNDVDPTRKLIRQVLGAVSEWEKSNLVRKLRAARERKGRMGNAIGYGTKEAEGPVLEIIFNLHREGRSCRDIATTLNALRIRTRFGRFWYHNQISRILQRAAG